MSNNINIEGVMQALARLKGIPVAKVLRNAARDFTQGAYKATPLAQVSKSPYYTFVDARTGQRRYLRDSQVETETTRTGKAKMSAHWRGLKAEFHLRKVRVAKGWSKATWAGVMRSLGMAAKATPARLPQVVETKSELTEALASATPKVTIMDEFRIDDFGKGSTAAKHQQIAQAGFALAAKRMTAEYARMLRRAW